MQHLLDLFVPLCNCPPNKEFFVASSVFRILFPAE